MGYIIGGGVKNIAAILVSYFSGYIAYVIFNPSASPELGGIMAVLMLAVLEIRQLKDKD